MGNVTRPIEGPREIPDGVPAPSSVVFANERSALLNPGNLARLLRRGQENPDHKVVALCRETSKWWAALWTIAPVEGLEPTNNMSERALRPAVLWRKGSFRSASEAGSRFAERLLTVVATCRQRGRSVLAFLVAAGGAALQGIAAPSLLPAQYGD